MGWKESFKREWPIWLVAGTTLVSGLLSILQMLFIRLYEHSYFFNRVLPFGLHYWGRSLTLIFGFMLIYLSLNLFQRRRIAMWLAVAASGIVVVANIASERLWYLAIAPLIAIILLLIFRRRFSVQSEPNSIRWGVGLMIVSLLVALLYGTIGFLLLNKSEFGVQLSFTDSLIRTIRQFILIGNNDLSAHTRLARWFLESLSTLGIIAEVFAAYSLFRPVAYRLRELPHERAVARAILERYGRSAYDFFKLWPDKSYFFSESNRSFIAYATARGVALSLGDPVGPHNELEKLIKSFLKFCSDKGWLVCFLMPDLLGTYRRLGLKTTKIGEEAIVNLEHFYSHTAQRKYFRYLRNKFERRGYKLIRYIPPHRITLLEEVEEVSREWLSLPKHRELGFLQGRFERSYLEKTPLCVVRDPAGHVIAFINEVPSYKKGEATFDMMRHIPMVPQGTMDYLFQGLMIILKQDGYKSFDLGAAPFVGVGNKPQATLIERALRLLFRMNWFISSRGISHYKIKFEPMWEDRFIAYQGGPINLVKIGLAVTQAVEGIKK
jgi:phosphatidylglycerol lysyltransferase